MQVERGRAAMVVFNITQELAVVLLVLACSCHVDGVEGKPLQILVPLRMGFYEFVSWEGTPPHNLTFSGFSVDVFERCVKRLPYKLDYQFLGFGDGVHDPSYNGMIQKLVNKEVDGVVADITITEDRMELVDFTQPYIQSSLVMMVPFHYTSAGQLWNFLRPFHADLWASIGAVFVATGIVIFILEKENLPNEGNLNWKARMADIFWFTAMSLFFCQRNEHGVIRSRLGQFLTVFWLVVVLILSSSYTASLTSLLLAQQPSPTIQSFEDLWRSNLRVGYHENSFINAYIQDSLYITPSRLVKLVTEADYADALKLGSDKGGVAAILDESPYIQTFLNSECQFTTSGAEIAYFGGFAFAFQKNSNLTRDISLAIISMEKNRELQNVKESWLGFGKCSKTSTSTYIPIKNFGGLFILVAIVYTVCVLWRVLEWFWARLCRERWQARKKSLPKVHDIDVNPIE